MNEANEKAPGNGSAPGEEDTQRREKNKRRRDSVRRLCKKKEVRKATVVRNLPSFPGFFCGSSEVEMDLHQVKMQKRGGERDRNHGGASALDGVLHGEKNLKGSTTVSSGRPHNQNHAQPAPGKSEETDRNGTRVCAELLEVLRWEKDAAACCESCRETSAFTWFPRFAWLRTRLSGWAGTPRIRSQEEPHC